MEMITTERTIIRKFKESDSYDLFEYLSLAETYTFEPGKLILLEEAKSICLCRSNGNTFFAVELKQENKVIGHFSLAQIEPEYVKTYEIGFIFNPKYQGIGLATESGLAFLDYVFKHFDIHKVVANTNPENTKSMKLLERVGIRKEGLLIKNIYFKKEADGNPIWQDTAIYGLVKS